MAFKNETKSSFLFYKKSYKKTKKKYPFEIYTKKFKFHQFMFFLKIKQIQQYITNKLIFTRVVNFLIIYKQFLIFF